MTEGELYKQILEKRETWCFCGGETDDPENKPKSCRVKREPTKEQIKQALDEARKELLTFKEFADADMMKERKPDFSDIYSVYISQKIEKWFGVLSQGSTTEESCEETPKK